MSIRREPTLRSVLVIALLFMLLSLSVGPLLAVSSAAQEIPSLEGHPRLFVRAEDLPRLRSWAVETNPVYQGGLAVIAAQAKADMDAGSVPDLDTGSESWEQYPSEQYAMLFAFMSLISNVEAERDDYAQRARTLLMYVMNQAVQGPTDGVAFRSPEFSTRDRSRWYGADFALTVDWIYPYLSAEDKATIRTVFLRWIDENLNATVTDNNHPEPIGVVNDLALLTEPTIRWASNNYFNAHMRNIGLMSMALDEEDDPDGSLRSYLSNAIGAWLYMVDYNLRHDLVGGLSAEGFEYGQQSLAYTAQFLLALHTAGQDDPAVWGQQVSFAGNPFWDQTVPAYLHSISPAPVEHPWLGEVYQPAWYGDAQNYWVPEMVEFLGPLGLYAADIGNTEQLNAIRWYELTLTPGGPSHLEQRASDMNYFLEAVFYFLLFDPTAPVPSDPRPALPTTLYVPGMRRLFARTDWTEDAAWFIYSLSWSSTDHQTANGNMIEFYRNGEWITKQRVGYDFDYGSSDNLNTLAIENDRPEREEDDYRIMMWRRGSQWLFSDAGDPPPPLVSMNNRFIYAQGDSTNLYNMPSEGLLDVLHASRSVLWLKPDYIFIFDRAETQTDHRFKRFFLNFATEPEVDGNITHMTTPHGQQVTVTTLLPTDAVISAGPAPEEPSGDPAAEEPMAFRLQVEALGGPRRAEFLNVLGTTAAEGTPISATLIESEIGTAYAGAVLGDTVVMFARNISESFEQLQYTAPASTTLHLITGLQPDTAYEVMSQVVGDSVQITIRPGSGTMTDSGGVLTVEL